VYELLDNGDKEFVEFTGAQLLKGSLLIQDYIQHWHDGRSFFEFVPQDNSILTLRVFKNYTED
jgi:hypothetical protein